MLSWAFFSDGVEVGGPLQVLGHRGSQKPEGLHRRDGAIEYGEGGVVLGGGGLLLKSTVTVLGLVQLQAVVTAPENQLFHLLSVHSVLQPSLI